MPHWSAADVSVQKAYLFPNGIGMVGWGGGDPIPLWFAGVQP